MAGNQFKIGDIVRLKSGGPDMTVNELPDQYNGYRCQWFAGKKLERGIFEPDAIQLVPQETK